MALCAIAAYPTDAVLVPIFAIITLVSDWRRIRFSFYQTVLERLFSKSIKLHPFLYFLLEKHSVVRGEKRTIAHQIFES